MKDPALTQTLAVLNTAIAALRYCRKHQVDLPEEMPDHFDEGGRVTEQHIDAVVEQLNREFDMTQYNYTNKEFAAVTAKDHWITIALDSLLLQ